jgi:hypothetical protein
LGVRPDKCLGDLASTYGAGSPFMGVKSDPVTFDSVSSRLT